MTQELKIIEDLKNSNTCYKVYGHEPIPNIDNWKEFVESRHDVTSPMLYIDATADFIKLLQPITEHSDFASMKEALTQLLDERQKFLFLASKNPFC